MHKYTTLLSIFLFWACIPKEKSATTQEKKTPTKSTIKPQRKPESTVQINTTKPVKKHLNLNSIPKDERSTLNVEKSPKNNSTKAYAYTNPSLSLWDEHFGKDPKWMALYQESVDHYLLGVANNLEQQPTLRIARSMLVFVYGKKMNETFVLSPEFVEFAKNKFEHSTELSAFIQTHPTRIIED